MARRAKGMPLPANRAIHDKLILRERFLFISHSQAFTTMPHLRDDRWDDDDSDDLDTDAPESLQDSEDEPTVPCPWCKREMLEDCDRCPSCGQYISSEDAPVARKPLWIIGGTLACLYIVSRWVLWTIACLLTTSLAVATAGDWPEILGPHRNGIAAADERLADAWPADGPLTVWEREVGSGYAGVAVARNRMILFHRQNGREVVESLDAATGKSLWSESYPTTFAPQVGGGDGPLCVPIIHDTYAITFGAQGVLAAWDIASGKRLWMRQTQRDFDVPDSYFGVGSSPIVVGKHVVVNIGGTRTDAGICAFSLANGETIWKKTNQPASYSSPVCVSVSGEPHVLMVTRYACLLIAPASGEIRWQFPFGQRGPTVNAATPLVFDDKHLLVTASYGIGSVYASFDLAGVQKVWEGEQSLASQYCTPIELEGYLYAIDGRDDMPPADLKCVEKTTGRVLWVVNNFGYGTLLLADGKLLVVKTDGEIVLMRPSAAEAKILAKARPLQGTVRALPALASGRLYLRNDRTLKCLSVGKDPTRKDPKP